MVLHTGSGAGIVVQTAVGYAVGVVLSTCEIRYGLFSLDLDAPHHL